MELVKNEIPEEYETKEKMWIYKEKPEVFKKFNQIEIFEEEKKIPIIKNEKIQKQKKNSPLELIIEYTSCNEIMKREIKEKLIELITIPEFSKAFGLKKSGEIVSAITRDSWNQSIALFISFLLDSSVIYKEKSYIYNKDKVTKEIKVIS